MDPKNYNTIYGECRCCLTKGHHKDIMKEYYWNGSREVYYDTFMECFNLFLSTNTNLSTLICSPCVQKLRDANSFRTMVASTEQKLLRTLNDDQTVFVNVGAHTLDSDIKLEDIIEVKEELTDLEEHDVMDYDNDPDYLPSDEHCDNDSPDVTSNISSSINKARTSNYIKQHQIPSSPKFYNPSYAPSDTNTDNSFDSIIYEKNGDETYLPSTDDYKANSSAFPTNSSNLSNGTSTKNRNEKCILFDHTSSTNGIKDTSDYAEDLPPHGIEYSNEISLIIIQNTESVTKEKDYTETPQDTIMSDPLAINNSPLMDVTNNITADEFIAPSSLNEHLISTIAFDNSFIENSDTSNVPELTQDYDKVSIPPSASEESSLTIHNNVIITQTYPLIENSDTSNVLKSSQSRDEVYIPPSENEDSGFMTKLNNNTITTKLLSSCSMPISEQNTSPQKHKTPFLYSDIANSDVLNAPGSTISEYDDSDRDATFCPRSIESSSGSNDEKETNDSFIETKHQIEPQPHHLEELRDQPLSDTSNTQVEAQNFKLRKSTRNRKENTTKIIDTQRQKSARIRTKDFCYFCKTYVLNFARHIIRNHAMKPEVQKILSYRKKSCTRKNLITTLRKKGNYLINVSECTKPMKKSNINPNMNYLPCVKCLGFYSMKQLWKHRRACQPLSETSNTQVETQNFTLRKSTRNRKENTTKIIDTQRQKLARIRTKDYCYFCNTYVLNFARHIIRNHAKEPEVQKILSYRKKSCTRKNLITTLRKKGNYLINVSECIKPVKKSNINPNMNYLPCVKCLGFYSRKQLWKHRRTCQPLSETSNTQVEAQNFTLRKSTRNRKENTTKIIDTQRQKSARIRTKDFCYFCKTYVLNFARHIIRNHAMEAEVQKILSYPKKSCTRKNLITTLRKKGNYMINVSECIKPMKKSNINPQMNYLPCVKCLGFYSRKQLWKHRRACQPLSKTSKTQVEAQNFMLRHLNLDNRLKQEVLPKMRPDRVSLEAKKDQLICAFGAQYIRVHRDKHFINVTSRKMRELARLLIELKKMNPSFKDLMDCLKPQNYDLIVTATKKVSRYDDKTNRYRAPTYAINISTSLRQCCNIAIKTTLKSDSRVKTVATDFKALITLIETNWKFDISNQAWSDLNLKSGIK